MEIQVDRTIAIPLAQQIKGQIAYAISCGILRPGQRLPTLRELSASLGVAYMTIGHVYRELAEVGLVIGRPAQGTFVADVSRLGELRHSPRSRGNLAQLAAAFVRQAMLVGHEPEEIRAAVAEQLDGAQEAATWRHVLLVGNARPATESYARAIETLLQDLRVRVHPVLLSELTAAPEASLAGLPPAQLAIGVPTELNAARELLEPRGYQVVSVAFELSPETRQQLAAVPAPSRLGVLATQPQFLGPLLQGVASYTLAEAPPSYAVMGDSRRIRKMLAAVDLVVYHSGCEQALAEMPSGVEAIEYRYSPEADSVARLRPLIESLPAVRAWPERPAEAPPSRAEGEAEPPGLSLESLTQAGESRTPDGLSEGAEHE